MKRCTFRSNWTCKHLGAPDLGAPVMIPHEAMLGKPRNELAASGVYSTHADVTVL